MFHARYDIIGKNKGNFRYGKIDEALFLENLKHQLDKRGIKKVLIPHCTMTTNLASLEMAGLKEITPWFIRTEPGFDGAIVTEPNTAIGILNADCPVITLFDNKKGRLVLLHAGLRCLVPEDSSQPNIINKAFEDLKINPSEVFLGFGAGSCCYGAEHHSKELNNPNFWPFISRAYKGPRTGQLSLNLLNLAAAEIRKQGVGHEYLEINLPCTACLGRDNDDKGRYHSNIYEGKSAGRNLVLAWFAS